MDAANEGRAGGGSAGTTVERTSDRDLVVRRMVNGPARTVFAAWTTPELFMRWWTPKSFGISVISCDMDVRKGGGYRLVLRHPSSGEPMEFFGRYTDVTPPSRLVWTNDEADEDGAVTTVTFEERGGQTLVVLTDRYPSKDALDEAMASQSTSGFGESFDQLDALVASLPKGA